ncbi:60S ribosomal protein L7a-1 [Stylosanthes scabra]|uniref:60S ribosomal protein L7a-1 n=1 Tax=Stylosanthes scabra TaxID=79078 RepID=A0ABU6YRW8_9FABA|nr:60S ribosomal protein L7a-1 [Stylosanthes scabra]
MMWTQLNWLSGFQHCVGRWKFHNALSRARLALVRLNFNDKFDEYKKKWGGGIMGSKSQAKTKAKERLLAKEAAQRMT